MPLRLTVARGSVRQHHGVNDVNDAVVSGHVGLGHLGVVHRHVAVFDLDAQEPVSVLTIDTMSMLWFSVQ